jgi:DNA-binding winged helix-turn-helix (wHTH) protein
MEHKEPLVKMDYKEQLDKMDFKVLQALREHLGQMVYKEQLGH